MRFKLVIIIDIGHEEFERKRKEYYKHDVSPAVLLKQKVAFEEEDDAE